jgi:endonuclease G
MKNILISLFALLLLSSGKPPLRDNVVVKNDMFTIVYSEVLEQPKKVEYTIHCTETKFSRDGLDFFTCDSVKTSDNADYANNEWDKGHMAPAAAFSCEKQKLKNTFTYLNCALQQENLNRGVWRFLEAHERTLAKSGDVKVSIDLHFSKGSKVLPSGATIPDGFTKKVTTGGVTEVYYFPNARPTKKTYREYLVK